MSANASYTTIVGLEVHVQLLTRTKLFCGCENRFNPTQPNVQTCPVCLGLPGSLPVMNRLAFELAPQNGDGPQLHHRPFHQVGPQAVLLSRPAEGIPDQPVRSPFQLRGLAGNYDRGSRPGETHRHHPRPSRGRRGQKSARRNGPGRRQPDRPQPRGTPLLEIVSKPDLRSGAEAHAYLDELKLLLTYLEVSDCNMQEGSLRCDANVNLHIPAGQGQTVATPIVEIKNLNSFRGVEAAIEFEATRQFEEWQRSGHKLGDVPKETRGWDAERAVTFAQRGKEEASDYRYFPDPDLVPVTVSEEHKVRIRGQFVEFPAARRHRFQTEHRLSPYDASVIVAQGQSFADYFERVAAACGDAKQAANWVTQDVLREMKERKLPIEEFPIGPDVLASILSKISRRQITTNSGRTVFNEIMAAAPMQATGAGGPPVWSKSSRRNRWRSPPTRPSWPP